MSFIPIEGNAASAMGTPAGREPQLEDFKETIKLTIKTWFKPTITAVVLELSISQSESHAWYHARVTAFLVIPLGRNDQHHPRCNLRQSLGVAALGFSLSSASTRAAQAAGRATARRGGAALAEAAGSPAARR